MQTLWSYANSLREAYNSINPATLTGSIDVIVVEHADGTLLCSPFHVRFGKYQILRPSQKRVEFRVNDVKQDIPMKLGEGGEAFFVIETTENIAPGYQTSPLVSPAASPKPQPAETTPTIELPEPEPLDLATSASRAATDVDNGNLTPRPRSPGSVTQRPISEYMGGRPSAMFDMPRALTADILPSVQDSFARSFQKAQSQPPDDRQVVQGLGRSRSNSPPPVSQADAMTRAINLSKKLFSAKIPTKITDSGDLMLDMTGYKTTTEEALEVELMARKVLQEELEGNYDIGSLIGVDQDGNIWIYSSEEAKEEADRKATMLQSLTPTALRSSDAISDPGYHSDDAQSEVESDMARPVAHLRRDSDSAVGLSSTPASPNTKAGGDGSVNYAKSLRLGHEMLKSLNLKPGINSMSFSVNKATCHGFIYLWRYDTPIVISDIDGTITKSDALGHVLNAVGRDWTHAGVAKLYTDIAANGYNILYLTSRSIGQADTTRNYLNGIVQEGYRVPRGPVILSPDRTIAALRREVIIKKPEIFKMGCLRDIRDLYYPDRTTSKHDHARTPFYAGFGNRLNDALSYRSVAIPATRIFTINGNSEVSMHLLTLNSYRTSYVSMRELVDHYFPPLGLLVKEGGEEFTDFSYWRDPLLEVDEFSASESGSEEDEDDEYRRPSIDDASLRSEDEGDEDAADMEASRFSRESIDESSNMEDSIMESVEGDEPVVNSVHLAPVPVAADTESSDEDEDDDDDDEDEEESEDETPPARDLKALSLADQTPVAKPRDPQDDLTNLAKVLSSPERTPKRNAAVKQRA